MKKMLPGERQRMLDGLLLLRELVESAEVQKSCLTCDHWQAGRCRMADAVPPDEVRRDGCEAWEYQEIPF